MAWPGVCAQPCVCGVCAVSADWPCAVCVVSVSRAYVLCAMSVGCVPCLGHTVCRVYASLSCACVVLYVGHAVCVACARVVCACLSAVYVECRARVTCAVRRAC